MKQVTSESTGTPAIVISYTRNIAEGQSVVFQTHVAQDADAGDINALLDKLSRASARQSAAGRLKDLQFALSQLSHHRKMSAGHMKEALMRLEKVGSSEGRSGKAAQIIEAERAKHLAEVKNYENELVHFDRTIEKHEFDIAEAKALIDGTNGGADSSASDSNR